MHRHIISSINSSLVVILMALPLTACADRSQLPPNADFGPNPILPPPVQSAIPTVNIAPAKGWPAGAKPVAAPGFTVTAFATDLDHPRWMHVLPNGDVLVAETDAPPKPDANQGIKGWVMKFFMKRAGSNQGSANRITLLRDADNDGVAEMSAALLLGLNSPFGMTLVGNTLYVANTDAIMAFPYRPGDTQITSNGRKIADLPAGPINHHWTKNIIASRDGKKLYATSGSNSNVGENGMEAEVNRAAILEVDIKTGKTRLFASGLRNPNGLAWHPQSRALWTTVNERDALGSDLVPDFMTSVKDGGFYGWPYSYYGQYLDPRPEPQRPDLVRSAIVPDYALGAHTSSMGLAFYDKKLFAERFQNGAFIGQHGSWNRKPKSGYKVIFVPFQEGKPAGPPEDFLTGFLNEKGHALGRPVGVVVDRKGAILVADDVGNAIWRVTPDPAADAALPAAPAVTQSP